MKFSIEQPYSTAGHRKLIKCEGLAQKDLDTLLHHIHSYLEQRGFTVKQDDRLLERYKNMEGSYKNVTTFNDAHVVNNEGILLCASDGQQLIYGDYNSYNNCSISLVLYHILHMTGHLWQWNCEDIGSGLKFMGREAWELGQKIYEEEKESIHLPDIIAYETEAVFLSLLNLERIYAGTNLDLDFCRRFSEYYKYYSLVDINALIQYFDAYRYVDIFEMKNFRIDKLHLDYSIKPDFKINIRKREDFQ